MVCSLVPKKKGEEILANLSGYLILKKHLLRTPQSIEDGHFIITVTDLDEPVDKLHEGLEYSHIAHLLDHKNCERWLVPGKPLACGILYRPVSKQHVIRSFGNTLLKHISADE
jgi:hypothetical protein